jgi:hypothetical protein|tara:strand:- start:291 stop:491 length:201 start_codon:yes stop_codon:yes gene_type:complete
MHTKEEYELEEMLVGAKRREEDLIDRIIEIASIIYMQMPLRYQDDWLDRQVNDGLYNPSKDVGDDE